jgi:putative phosphoesterase
MKLGLVSDTHGHWDEGIERALAGCDAVWHAGDIGDPAILDRLDALAPSRAVYGNIDAPPLRQRCPEVVEESLEGHRLTMLHIGGRPGRYAKGVPQRLKQSRPYAFICGHSHILKVQYDQRYGCWYLNPGAAGHQGFHTVRTLLYIYLGPQGLENAEVVELGRRGKGV